MRRESFFKSWIFSQIPVIGIYVNYFTLEWNAECEDLERIVILVISLFDISFFVILKGIATLAIFDRRFRQKS